MPFKFVKNCAKNDKKKFNPSSLKECMWRYLVQ